MRIGVLALQGDFAEHIAVLNGLGVTTQEVRLPAELEAVDGLIIPGGESTTIVKLLDAYGLTEPLKQRVGAGMPVLGTCAGMIVMAREVTNNSVTPLNLIDVTVRRNAFGRQLESFEADLKVDGLGDAPYHAVFIRAPMIKSVAEDVSVLARLNDGSLVAARRDNVLVAAFHPELTPDPRFHEYFVNMVRAAK
jgi:pyridoxal 5'-phosphate synthase pdxT subunit